jgi:hypothetical protein
MGIWCHQICRKKDVLIVHAAGNDGKDIDSNENFPNDSDDKKQNMQTIC